ncbi:hypothetical protein DRF62_04300 [Chryseobacterium piscium]|uniref:Uncharacterized protein n=1 Tax=Chryseobacterium piscium TaxID=333702 RepID=A0A3D9BRZ6_9FLAO|nr:hypothetical protein DRF62_04300 [Chryseobacterium piscium]
MLNYKTIIYTYSFNNYSIILQFSPIKNSDYYSIFLISNYVKSDKKLLFNSVIELTKYLRKIISVEDYECILLEQNNPHFG